MTSDVSDSPLGPVTLHRVTGTPATAVRIVKQEWYHSTMVSYMPKLRKIVKDSFFIIQFLMTLIYGLLYIGE